MSRPEQPRLRTGEALLLGALHGPAELLPISSSAHVTLVPWLLSWRYTELGAEQRKSFEVALHAGTAAALLIVLRKDAITNDPRRVALLAASALPPGIVGGLLELPIERRLGTPATIAAGLLGGSVAMVLADRAPERRVHREAGIADGLWLGLAQAVALIPGVSRSGATLTAARLRRFTRADAHRLSRLVSLPVIAGATVLKGARMRSDHAGSFAAGATAAFASTLACSPAIRRLERDRSLLAYAVYRALLAAVVLARLWSGRSTTMER